MINTNDGYFWAEGARDILNGTNQPNDLSPTHLAASKLTAWIAVLVPFSFETLIFYLPAFLSSLLVIPLILIGRSFGHTDVGFIAALIGSIAWSYYNRTMVGYYDTDMLNIVFPTFLLWSLIYALRTKEEKYLLFTGLEIIAYRWWYPQSYALEFAFFGIILLYMLYLAWKKEEFTYELKLLSIMLFAMINLDEIIRLILVIAVYFTAKQNTLNKYVYYIFGASLILFFITGGFNPIWIQLQGYILREKIADSGSSLGLHFFNVLQTVLEAKTISFEMFANRISGHTITFIASFIGYILFSYKHRVMLVALPMLGLGFMAYGIPGLINGGGLRFTIYAVPVMALGLGYLIIYITSYLQNQLFKYLLIVALVIAALIPNIKHINDYKVPTVFSHNEALVLDKLKSIADREDYVVAWWDYGYPIRYYSDVKTLIDGGKHGGHVNFPVSYILGSPQDAAAKMARLDVEYTEKRFTENNNTKWAASNIEQMTLDYGFKNANLFLNSLSQNVVLPKKTRDIYIYLPNKMLDILPTVLQFSSLDLMTGEERKLPFFFISKQYQDKGATVELGKGVKILKEKNTVQLNNQEVPINSYIVTQYDANNVLQKQMHTVNENAPLSIIYMQNYNQILIVDAQMFYSLFIQLFVLESYHNDLYEPVVLNPWAKVFRLKI